MTSPLQLTRPLVSFDTETTGLDVSRDRIIEISCVKIHPDMRREVWTQRLNPGCAISPEATAVHGITADDLVGMPEFADVAPIILAIMEGCDLTGFNIEKFDVPLLTAEFRRVGMVFPEGEVSIIDSGKIFWRHEARDLKGALKFYCGRSLTQAHSAEADAQAAADVLLAQVERYADLPDDVPGLESWCHPHHPDWLDPDGKVAWLQGEAVITFGKHRNRSLRELAAEEPGYLQWICSKNFGEAVHGLCTEALAGNFPVRETQAQ
jgi:DNA polymerase-3 subunit epsilon